MGLGSSLLPVVLTMRKKMACHKTPPMAPPALTRPQTTPLERRLTKGTTPYTVPQVICTVHMHQLCGTGPACMQACIHGQQTCSCHLHHQPLLSARSRLHTCHSSQAGLCRAVQMVYKPETWATHHCRLDTGRLTSKLLDEH